MVEYAKGLHMESEPEALLLPLPGSGFWGKSLLKPEHLSCEIGPSVHTPQVIWECDWHAAHLSWAVNHILPTLLFQNLWPALFQGTES